MTVTQYSISVKKPIKPFTAAVVADLHNCPHDAVLETLNAQIPDLILIPGDLMSAFSEERFRAENERGFAFLEKAARLAPVFYSMGNHEMEMTGEARERMEAMGVTLLTDSTAEYREMLLGGVIPGESHHLRRSAAPPNLPFIETFAVSGGDSVYRILLCHNPEYYARYIQKHDIDLIVSGHAHGGQWRFFGRGIFAPGQGFFPKYTAGVHDKHLVISRGLGDRTAVPRLFNPHELVYITVK